MYTFTYYVQRIHACAGSSARGFVYIDVDATLGLLYIYVCCNCGTLLWFFSHTRIFQIVELIFFRLEYSGIILCCIECE